ncbi:MAG: Asparagine synthetase [Candidatus Magasanikbacteria bacterium GW2011_GWA2_56_11]|uniref:asparagine synthase (glutamine-hydrolyzing) n=1 Tax=Candidatus Magasanikbacteria bacterium GW2011_GWA2_56_11 TaxID=1619044 RepID=A0A0G1YEF0_9BACT|nr:MAG: Asparagine synthetase [Candidatus Magasanikbacteria bacterium GW2011_GWA2_56_11]
MCAINGFNFAAPDIIRQMNARTNHRGPDQTNVLVEEGISLGHNRLSIIDLSVAAGMPMESHDGRYVIVYNGELYNYLALRDELAAGYPFRTASDTEVILAAYARWGVGALERFNGMFAFAVWDRQKKELTVARDQAGIKPLYYYWQDGRFIFSSEIKAILEHPAVPRRLSAPALNHYLRALYVPGPLTMFSGINKLLPGQTARLKAGELTIEPYCVPSPAPALTGSSGQMAELVARTIDEAVRRQLVSDRPVGVYLSGGIDSSVVLDAMSRERSRIDTFSVGYDLLPGENADKFNQDFIQAGRTARHYGTRHHEVLVSPKDVIELFEKTVWHMDEPISKPNAIAMMKLAHFVKPTATVVLGGDGGDELFGGYDRYRLSRYADIYQRLVPGFVRRPLRRSALLRQLDTPAGIDRYALFMFQKEAAVERVLKPPYFNGGGTHDFFGQRFLPPGRAQSFGDSFMRADRQSWLVDDSLALTDKMTMSGGVEARVPFLDRAVVELADRIPLKRKVHLGEGKAILKAAYRHRLPPELFGGVKRGWYAPGAKWLRRQEIYELASGLLAPEYNRETADLFAWGRLRHDLAAHRQKQGYHATMLYAVMTFQAWARAYRINI